MKPKTFAIKESKNDKEILRLDEVAVPAIQRKFNSIIAAMN